MFGKFSRGNSCAVYSYSIGFSISFGGRLRVYELHPIFFDRVTLTRVLLRPFIK